MLLIALGDMRRAGAVASSGEEILCTSNPELENPEVKSKTSIPMEILFGVSPGPYAAGVSREGGCLIRGESGRPYCLYMRI